MDLPTLPSWFKQRQAKAEPAGDNVLKVTAPNLGESYIAIRKVGEGLWQSALMESPTGPDLAATAPDIEQEAEAWGAAFELHRVNVMV